MNTLSDTWTVTQQHNLLALLHAFKPLLIFHTVHDRHITYHFPCLLLCKVSICIILPYLLMVISLSVLSLLLLVVTILLWDYVTCIDVFLYYSHIETITFLHNLLFFTWLFVCNFNIQYNFLTLKDRKFKFYMHTLPLSETFYSQWIF